MLDMVGAKGCERFALHQDLVPFSFKSSSKRHFASSFGLFCFNILDCQHGFWPCCNPETTSNKLEGMTVSPFSWHLFAWGLLLWETRSFPSCKFTFHMANSQELLCFFDWGYCPTALNQPTIIKMAPGEKDAAGCAADGETGEGEGRRWSCFPIQSTDT